MCSGGRTLSPMNTPWIEGAAPIRKDFHAVARTSVTGGA
jgi:hypothetical protein